MIRRLFLLLDTLVFFAMTWGMIALRHQDTFPIHQWRLCCVYFPIYLLVTFILWLFSFYDIARLRKKVISYQRLLIAWFITLVACATIIYFVSALPISIPTPRRSLLAILTIYFGYIYLLRRNYFTLNFAKTKLLFIGQSQTLDELILFTSASKGFVVSHWPEISSAQLPHIPRRLDRVIIASKLFIQHPQAWPIIAKQFIAKGMVVDTDFNEYERLLRRVSRESVQDEMWLLRGIGDRNENAMYNMLKRVLDMGLALFLLPFCLPIGIILWCMIRFIDGYPPFFIQKRVGALEKPIYVYKFRTIRPGGTEENITRCGKFLRRFRLDEIPQLINVLRGEISFVGPRPIWFNEHEFLKKYVPNHALRTIAKPGITGWAQLNFKAPPTYFNFRNNTPENLDAHAFDAAFTRFSYDVWYIKNRSIGLDFEILAKTALRMFIKDSKVS